MFQHDPERREQALMTSILSAARAVTVAALVAWPAASFAQTPAPTPTPTQQKPAAPAAPAKPQAKPAAAPAAPAQAAKPAAPKPATVAKPTQPAAAAVKPTTPPATKPATTAAAKPVANDEPKLLGQYGEWGAYTATPNGKKLCFALAKPGSSQTNPPNRPRDPAFLFISTRPGEKVKDEISLIIGYPIKPNTEVIAAVGPTTFPLYIHEDGAWVKNAPDEAKMIEAMRKGSDVVVKGESGKGTKTTDTFSLKGISQALDRVGQECK
jgi:hypothetical protein